MKQQKIIWVVECRDSKLQEWLPLYPRREREGARIAQSCNARRMWKFTRVVKYIREA